MIRSNLSCKPRTRFLQREKMKNRFFCVCYFVVLKKPISSKPCSTVKIGRHNQKDSNHMPQIPESIRKNIFVNPLNIHFQKGSFIPKNVLPLMATPYILDVPTNQTYVLEVETFFYAKFALLFEFYAFVLKIRKLTIIESPTNVGRFAPHVDDILSKLNVTKHTYFDTIILEDFGSSDLSPT